MGLKLAILWPCLVSTGNTGRLHHLQPCLPGPETALCIPSQLAYCLFESPGGWKSSPGVALPSAGHKAVSMHFPEQLFHCSGLHPSAGLRLRHNLLKKKSLTLFAHCSTCSTWKRAEHPPKERRTLPNAAPPPRSWVISGLSKPVSLWVTRRCGHRSPPPSLTEGWDPHVWGQRTQSLLLPFSSSRRTDDVTEDGTFTQPVNSVICQTLSMGQP